MTKREAEGILAYIWVKKYNTLPFEEASEKIIAYLIENKYVITNETKAEFSNSTVAMVSKRVEEELVTEELDSVKSEEETISEKAEPVSEGAETLDKCEPAVDIVKLEEEKNRIKNKQEVESIKCRKRKKRRKRKNRRKRRKGNYFKRVKQPITRPEAAKPLIRETIIYFLICLIGCVTFSVLGGFFSSLAFVFFIVAIVAFGFSFYFGLMLYAMKRAVKWIKNKYCNVCNSELVNDENTTWTEISRRWRLNSDKSKAEGKLYVTVRITCICPVCGTSKTFTETLCSGNISVTDYAIRDTLVSTQTLVDDYFNKKIHIS